MSLQAFAKGEMSTAASINRQLTDFNPELLSPRVKAMDDQPMVESVGKRLKELKDREGLSYEKFGAIAGVSAQAVQKWMRGGKIKPEHVERLADHFEVSPAWITFGQKELPVSVSVAEPGPEMLSPLALDVARRWQSLSPERQDWFRDLIFTMHFVERRFPAMRKGRPRGESYDKLEAAFERDMRQLKLKLE